MADEALRDRSTRHPSRRRVLTLGAAAGAATLLGCGADDASGDGDGSDGTIGTSGADTSGSPSTSGVVDSSEGADASGESVGTSDGSSSEESSSGAVDSTSEGTTGDCPPVAGWATGGTASMCGVYPDPFERGLGEPCELLCSATLGPCYDETFDRKDVSEGADGLPTRFAFLVVDETCTPIAGAEVDIWHTSATGFYSGAEASPGCTLGDPDALAGHWFRGIQTTDANGRADFDSCFPGWYAGRTIHIHLTVRVGGVEYVTSQLYFDDALCDAIIASEPIYSDRGPRDRTNATDGIFPDGSGTSYLFETAHMDDGAMLAWKALVIRSSVADPLCAR